MPYDILTIPIAIIMMPLVGYRRLQKPSLREYAMTTVCLVMPSRTANCITIGIIKNALAVLLPMKNSRRMIKRKMSRRDVAGDKSSMRL